MFLPPHAMQGVTGQRARTGSISARLPLRSEDSTFNDAVVMANAHRTSQREQSGRPSIFKRATSGQNASSHGLRKGSIFSAAEAKASKNGPLAATPEKEPEEKVALDPMQSMMLVHMLNEEINEAPWCRIGGGSDVRRTWDFSMVFLVLFTIIEVPFSIAFYEDGEGSIGLETFDWIVLVIFWFDFISNFFTTFSEGEDEVYDLRRIFKHYTHSPWFFIDLLSCVPTQLVSDILKGGSRQTSLLKGLKLFRMVRMGKLFKQMDDLMYASAFRLLRLLGFIFLMVHWAACLWKLVMGKEFEIEQNIRFCDCLECSDNVIEGDETDVCAWRMKSLAATYSACYYYAVSYLLGLGAVGPVTSLEQFFASMLSVYGACLQACVFGSVAVLIAGLDADETKFQHKLEAVSMRMRQLGLPDWLRKRVLSYYDMVREYEHSIGDDVVDGFLKDLSPSLQMDIKICLFRTLVSKVPFFSNPDIESAVIEDFVTRMGTALFLPGDTIIRKVCKRERIYSC